MRNVLLKVAMFFAVIAVVGFIGCSKSGDGGGGYPGNNSPVETIMDYEPTNSSLSQEVREEFETLLSVPSTPIEESTYELEFTQYKDSSGGSGLTRSFNINGQSLSTKISVALIKKATKDKYYLNNASIAQTHSIEASVLSGNSSNITLTHDGIILTAKITETAFGSYTIRVVATLGNITITKDYEFNYANDPSKIIAHKLSGTENSPSISLTDGLTAEDIAANPSDYQVVSMETLNKNFGQISPPSSHQYRIDLILLIKKISTQQQYIILDDSLYTYEVKVDNVSTTNFTILQENAFSKPHHSVGYTVSGAGKGANSKTVIDIQLLRYPKSGTAIFSDVPFRKFDITFN